MKTIGLIGGITCCSSIDYYRYINELVNKRSGGDESARVILNSVNYGEIKALTYRNEWDAIATIISNAARKTEKAGAECIYSALIPCTILQIRFRLQFLSL
jgi:aspartate racemase